MKFSFSSPECGNLSRILSNNIVKSIKVFERYKNTLRTISQKSLCQSRAPCLLFHPTFNYLHIKSSSENWIVNCLRRLKCILFLLSHKTTFVSWKDSETSNILHIKMFLSRIRHEIQKTVTSLFHHFPRISHDFKKAHR